MTLGGWSSSQSAHPHPLLFPLPHLLLSVQCHLLQRLHLTPCPLPLSFLLLPCVRVLCVCLCPCVSVCVCVCARARERVCTHKFMCLRACLCVYVCVHACVCVCVKYIPAPTGVHHPLCPPSQSHWRHPRLKVNSRSCQAGALGACAWVFPVYHTSVYIGRALHTTLVGNAYHW
jgi:hypothetical protein